MSRKDELLKEFEAHARIAVDATSLMHYIARVLHENTARFNWVGFYLMETSTFETLVLGPYAGSFMPTLRIPLDKGLCGAAATSGKTVMVNDVRNDPRYIGSDVVKSNVVVPIFLQKRVVAELDVESYFVGTFMASEVIFIESCAAIVGRFMAEEAAGDAASAGR